MGLVPANPGLSYEFVCDDRIEEQLRLKPDLPIQICRIVQEAVSDKELRPAKKSYRFCLAFALK